MGIAIRSVNTREKVKINYRNVFLEGRVVRSVSINQTDGSFVTTEPLENSGRIIVYPQSPNNPLYTEQVYKDFGSYGTLNVPMDASFDYVRRKIWIADTGNSRVLNVNINNYAVEYQIGNLILPHSVVPEINKGGVFVKGFSGVNTGALSYYSSTGELIETFTYPCALGRPSTEVEDTLTFVRDLPLPSSMVYDHVRWRLWWTADNYVYMADLRNGQVVQKDMLPEYEDLRGIDVDFASGNAFVIAQKPTGAWFLVQLFRDNNKVFCDSYLEIGDMD